MKLRWLALPVLSLGVVGLLLVRRKPAREDGGCFPSCDPPEPSEDDEPMTTTHPNDKPLKSIAGEATDPKVAPLLAELQQQFDARGITAMTAFDLVVMPKAPLTDGPDPDHDKTRPVAIPDKSLWPGLLLIAEIVDSVSHDELAGLPLRYTGYREGYGSDGRGTGSYNRAVGGAPNSAHIRANAIDVWLGYPVLKSGDAKAIKEARARLKLAFARYFLEHPNEPFGFGVYTNDIHFDVDKRRTWGDAQEWIDKARALS